MLVRAGDEVNIIPVQPLEPRHDVRADGFVSMADVRACVGVGNGGGDVEMRLCHERMELLFGVSASLPFPPENRYG